MGSLQSRGQTSQRPPPGTCAYIHKFIRSYIYCALLRMYLLIPLQFMPKPSSQVLSAAVSDVEMEGGIEQQRTLGKAWRKRPPEDQADREWKRQKDSDSAGQHSSAIIDEIGREVKQCIDVNIEVLKTNEIEPEEVITLLCIRICQCIAHTLDQQLGTLRIGFVLGIVSEIVGLYCISYMLNWVIIATTLFTSKCTLWHTTAPYSKSSYKIWSCKMQAGGVAS